MRISLKEKFGFADYFYIFIFIVMIVVFCTPKLNQGLFLAVVVVLLFLMVFSKFSTLGGRNRALSMSVFGFIVLIFMYRFSNISDDGWGRYVIYTLYNLQFLLVPLLATFKSKIRNYIWWGVLTIALLNLIYNIAIRIFIPEIGESARYFEEGYLETINVGTSSFYTFSLFFFDVCFFLFLNSKKRIKMIMMLLSIVTTVFIVWFSLKASVVVFYLMSVVLLVLTRGKKEMGRIWLLFITFILCYWIFTEYSNEIIRFLVSNSPSERLTKRLVMLVDDQSVYASDSSFNSRKDLWLMSLSTWLQSPISFMFGIGNHYSSGGNNYGIGQHSELLDLLAEYGLLGGIIISAIFVKSFSSVKAYFNKQYHLQINMIFLIYLACGFTKYIFYPIIGCTVFFLLPLASQFVSQSPNKNGF